MNRITLLLFSTVLLASGCDVIGSSSGSSGELSIATDLTTYFSGQRVAVRFDNSRSAPILYDNCATVLQRKTENGWEVHSSMICDPLAAQFDVRIEAGEVFSDSLVWFRSGESTPGTYRFKFAVTGSDGDLLPEKERLTGSVKVERK